MSKSFESTWNNCLTVIKDNVSIQAFKTWFEPIKPVKLKSNVLTIQVFYQCKGGTYPNTPGGKSQVQLTSHNTENLYTFTWSNPT